MVEQDSSILGVAIVLRRALTRLNRRLRSQSRELGLSVAAHTILGHLYRDGAKTPGALAIAERIQPQSLTRVLAELEEADYILRQQNEKDRRQHHVQITLAGRDVLERDAKKRALWLASAMMSCLSSTEQELLRLGAQLMDRLADLPFESLEAYAAEEESAKVLRSTEGSPQ